MHMVEGDGLVGNSDLSPLGGDRCTGTHVRLLQNLPKSAAEVSKLPSLESCTFGSHMAPCKHASNPCALVII